MDWMPSIAFFALTGIGGGTFFYRRGAGPLWLTGWLGLTIVAARIILLPQLFGTYLAGAALGFGGGWLISRLRNRSARIAALLFWIALPVASFLYVFWPGPGSEMFGFAILLFTPVLLGWIVATLLGLGLKPRS